MHRPVVCRTLLHFSIMKMEAMSSSETSVNLYQTIPRHIPEDSTFYSHCHMNLDTTRKKICILRIVKGYVKLDKL